MDERFLDRVLRASGVVAGLAGLCGWAYLGSLWALAFLLAAAWSIINLWVLACLLIQVFERGNRLSLLLFFCLKVPVLYGLILLYLLFVPIRPSALIGGVTLPYVIIVLKALGRFLVEAMGQKQTPPAAGTENGQQSRTR